MLSTIYALILTYILIGMALLLLMALGWNWDNFHVFEFFQAVFLWPALFVFAIWWLSIKPTIRRFRKARRNKKLRQREEYRDDKCRRSR